MTFRFVASASALAIALAVPSAALAQQEWTMASAKRDPDIGAMFDREFASAAAEATDELSGVETQYVGNEQEMVQQVIRGRLDAGVTSPLGLAAAMPDIAVLNVPYLWQSQEERDFVYGNYLMEPLQELFADSGLVLLSVQEAGYNGVFCTFDCHDPSALEGQRARVSPSASSQMFWESIGAIPVQLPLSDAWSALEQELVVAGELPIGFFSTTPGAATAQHFVYTRHTHSPWLYFVNQRQWDALGEEAQQAVRDAMPEPYATSLRFFEDQDVRAEAYTDMGGTLYTLTDEQRAAWADRVTPNIDDFVADMGPEAQVLYEAVQEGTAAFAEQQSD